MRKKMFMICLIVILVMCAALVICGCGARQAMPQDGITDGDVVTASGSGSNVDVAAGTKPKTSETSEEKDSEGDEESQKPKAAEKTGSVATDGPSEGKASEPQDEDAPLRGDDRSIMGVPDALDVRTEDDGDLLVVVNKYHAVSKDYKPIGLVNVDNKYGTWKNMQLKSETYDAYLKLYKDAEAQGFNLKLCSAMRTYSIQKNLYENAVANRGREVANIRSAYPGRSEHHTGLAIDVTSASMDWGLEQDFIDYPDGKWINDHCHEYGFIIRYPKGKTMITGYDYEPWHLRYVGVDAATYIMENNLTLEEYVGVE